VICPNSDAPFSVNKKSEACQPQPSLLVFVLAIEAYDLVLCLALTGDHCCKNTPGDTIVFRIEGGAEEDRPDDRAETVL
jgi:hypothetical protein